jgi:ribonuclease HI
MQVLGKPTELNKVTLMWILWHQGIQGNEEADKLAKLGVTEVPPNQFIAISFSVGEKLIKQHLELKHEARWLTALATDSPKCW